MWKCNNCQAEIEKDKFKNCWNCGNPKEIVGVIEQLVEKIPSKPEPLRFKPPIEIKPLAELKLPEKVKPQSKIETLEIIENSVITENPIVEKSPTKTTYKYENNFLAQYESKPKKRAFSIIGKIIQIILWLVAVSSIAYFAYISKQKTESFERKINEEFQSFNNQKSRFIFPPIPVLRRGTVIEGMVKAKVLPLQVKTGNVDSLFSSLPDDLRPITLDEIKTLMWIDCENSAVSKYSDGAIGYREKCTVYLVEKETSKFIGIQEFLGDIPALAKEKEGQDAIGKVFPAKYISYLREKQPAAERQAIQNSFDSPNHHFYNKSEFIYAIFLLCLLAAIGFGWVAFNLRFSRNKEN
ncbi:MAG: hypothetical protein AAB336_03695 [Acidobacteriota bacterium]